MWRPLQLADVSNVAAHARAQIIRVYFKALAESSAFAGAQCLEGAEGTSANSDSILTASTTITTATTHGAGSHDPNHSNSRPHTLVTNSCASGLLASFGGNSPSNLSFPRSASPFQDEMVHVLLADAVPVPGPGLASEPPNTTHSNRASLFGITDATSTSNNPNIPNKNSVPALRAFRSPSATPRVTTTSSSSSSSSTSINGTSSRAVANAAGGVVGGSAGLEGFSDLFNDPSLVGERVNPAKDGSNSTSSSTSPWLATPRRLLQVLARVLPAPQLWALFAQLEARALHPALAPSATDVAKGRSVASTSRSISSSTATIKAVAAERLRALARANSLGLLQTLYLETCGDPAAWGWPLLLSHSLSTSTNTTATAATATKTSTSTEIPPEASLASSSVGAISKGQASERASTRALSGLGSKAEEEKDLFGLQSPPPLNKEEFERWSTSLETFRAHLSEIYLLPCLRIAQAEWLNSAGGSAAASAGGSAGSAAPEETVLGSAAPACFSGHAKTLLEAAPVLAAFSRHARTLLSQPPLALPGPIFPATFLLPDNDNNDNNNNNDDNNNNNNNNNTPDPNPLAPPPSTNIATDLFDPFCVFRKPLSLPLTTFPTAAASASRPAAGAALSSGAGSSSSSSTSSRLFPGLPFACGQIATQFRALLRSGLTHLCDDPAGAGAGAQVRERRDVCTSTSLF
jgi:hypothetical protein